jgi:PAS domain S-box-containing protein
MGKGNLQPVAFYGTLIAVIGLIAGLSAVSYSRFHQEAETEAQNLVEVIRVDVQETLGRAQSDRYAFATLVRPEDLGPHLSDSRRQEMETMMALHLRHFPQISNYRIFTADGQTIMGAGTTKANFNVSDRDWFRTLKDIPGKEIFISDVVIGKGVKTSTIIIGVPIRSADGTFLGAVNAVLDLSYFQTVIDAPAIGPHGFIAIRRSDTSQLVVRHPNLADKINEPVASDLTTRIQSGDRSGVEDFASAVDHVNRVGAFEQMPDYPFVVIVGLARQDFLRPWLQQTTIAAIATALLEGMLGLLYVRQRRTQLSLEASRREASQKAHRYQFLLDSAGDGIHLLDEDGNLLEASNSFWRMLGYAPEQRLSLNVKDWDTALTDEIYKVRFRELVQTPMVFETRHQRADGSVIDVEVNCHGVELDGKACLYASSRDISDRKRLEEDLRRSNVELEQFAYVASHDLRSPLRAVTSYLSLVKRELGQDISPSIEEFIGFAIGGAKRMDSLITGLLDYSRIGKSGETPEAISLAVAINESLLNLELAIRDAAAMVTVADDLPHIVGDPIEVVRLFQNLIGNAIKYHAPDRAPIVSIDWQDQGKTWLVRVSDNGIGIPAADLERCFGIFQRLVTSVQYEGTGIGLAVCKKIVEHLGGRIWAESVVGEGSCFLISLPKVTSGKA